MLDLSGPIYDLIFLRQPPASQTTCVDSHRTHLRLRKVRGLPESCGISRLFRKLGNQALGRRPSSARTSSTNTTDEAIDTYDTLEAEQVVLVRIPPSLPSDEYDVLWKCASSLRYVQ